jgi:hypothetical protein
MMKSFKGNLGVARKTDTGGHQGNPWHIIAACCRLRRGHLPRATHKAKRIVDHRKDCLETLKWTYELRSRFFLIA